MPLLHGLLVVACFALIGGLIGYLTNIVAIEMLFRPKRPRCLLPGGRLCIQGLIPARKKALAKRLGEIAARYAYSDTVRARYRERLEREIVAAIRDAVGSRLRGASVASPLAEMLAPGLAELLARTLSPALMRLLDQASARINIAEIVEEEFMALPVDELERIFRQIAGRELRFIEVMGFILGSLIGLVEAVAALLV